MRRPVPWRLPGAGRSAEETPIPRYTLEAIIIVLLVLWLLGWLRKES